MTLYPAVSSNFNCLKSYCIIGAQQGAVTQNIPSQASLCCNTNDFTPWASHFAITQNVTLTGLRLFCKAKVTPKGLK